MSLQPRTAVGQAPVQQGRPQEASPLAGVRNVPEASHPDTAFPCTILGGLGHPRVLGGHMEASVSRGELCGGLAGILWGWGSKEGVGWRGLWEAPSPSQAMEI